MPADLSVPLVSTLWLFQGRTLLIPTPKTNPMFISTVDTSRVATSGGTWGTGLVAKPVLFVCVIPVLSNSPWAWSRHSTWTRAPRTTASFPVGTWPTRPPSSTGQASPSHAARRASNPRVHFAPSPSVHPVSGN